MNLPIEKKLSNDVQVKMARLQDSSIEALYDLDEKIVLHGGTSIWRCYSGNRFSDDLDLYVRTMREMSKIRNNLPFALKKYGISIAKVAAIGNSTIINVKDSEIGIRLEIGMARGRLNPIDRSFERSNGTRMSVITLSAEDLILEKIDTYSSRRYSRDIYDIYHLSPLANPLDIGKEVCSFLEDIKAPVDEESLGSIIYSGITPPFKSMVESIRAHFCEISK